MPDTLPLRPYALLCAICARGRGGLTAASQRVLQAIAVDPDTPITLRCNADSVYAYQNPGVADDTPESPEFNRKRDLDILQALDLEPGATLPARTLFHRVLKCIPTVRGLCGYGSASSEVWRGCPYADSGEYEREHARGISAIVPSRESDEMAREKAASVGAMEAASALSIRPHVVMCAICNYGKTCADPQPLPEDNIVEFIAIVRRRPDTQVAMARGADWMICAPCPMRVARLNACVNVAGSGGLSNEKRDLDLLQILGLRYGDTLPARDLLRLLFERVPSTTAICRRDNPPRSVWWDGCGEANAAGGNAGYEMGRELLMTELRLPAATKADSRGR